ncbi:hypothetical protein IV417_03635 [Alphaproteobacteria bacterium KMM 3653]|uniref:Uncharacterized protein n=1 Tax=Harenicola maris TaxID=2841044 RepID=A0AAP2CQ37_9RHOB|nr:hypothetical protein [Harenicola maris]
MKAAVGQPVVDGAGVAGVQVRAGGACGFVDGEGLALVKGEADAAQGRAGGAIGG